MMKKQQANVIRRDSDGHKYKLPIEKAEAFMWALDEIYKHEEGSDGFYDATDAFDATFGEYMTGEMK
jgi:hypothetical protein